MTSWSAYLREQAALAERIARSMPTLEMVREFKRHAESFRRDADAEDDLTGHLRSAD